MLQNEFEDIRIDTSDSSHADELRSQQEEERAYRNTIATGLVVIAAAIGFIGFVVIDVYLRDRDEGAIRAGRGDAAQYIVLQDRIVNGGQLRDVFVRLDRSIAENDVRTIAEEIRSEGGNPGTLSIAFLLPAMEIGNGAWARAIFKPDLRVEIFDTSVADEDGFRKPVLARGQIIGTWLWVLPSSSRTRTISKQGGEFYLTQRFASGEQSEERLIEIVPGRKYARADDRLGDYMLINKNGELELWDPEGRIDTLQRVGP